LTKEIDTQLNDKLKKAYFKSKKKMKIIKREITAPSDDADILSINLAN
jgi:hypothetical protein